MCPAILRMATVVEGNNDVTSKYADVSPAHLTRLPKGLEDGRTSLGEPSRPTLTHFSFLTCFFLLDNRIPHIFLVALVNTCFHSGWIQQCKCAAVMHRCNTTRIKKSNVGASMLASYHCNWNYFLLLGSKLDFELSTCHSGGCNPTFNTSTRVKPN